MLHNESGECQALQLLAVECEEDNAGPDLRKSDEDDINLTTNIRQLIRLVCRTSVEDLTLWFQELSPNSNGAHAEGMQVRK